MTRESSPNSRGVGGPLGAHLVFEMPLPAPECCLPLIALLDPHLMVCIAQVDFCEHLCVVQAIHHFGDEGEGEAILHSDNVEAPVVLDEAQLPIRALDEHNWSGGKRMARADETVGVRTL